MGEGCNENLFRSMDGGGFFEVFSSMGITFQIGQLPLDILQEFCTLLVSVKVEV